MSFQDEYKITNADRLDKGVYGLPDTPGMTTAAIQERFDSLGNLAIDKFNALVEAASDVVDGSDTKFPTNKAVEDYISGEGGAIIDDTTPSLHKAYSSQKVENMFGDVASRVIDDTEPLSNKTYSSEEIEEKLSNIPSPESIIDDDTASTDTTYSSSKLESDFISVSDTEEQTATDEFTTINGGLLSSLKVALSPNQDLHGYSEPWVGGAGKNKCEQTVDKIKSLNTSGTWNGNAYTWNGITYTILTDDANNVIGYDVDGTATARGWMFISDTDFGNDDIIYNGTTRNGYTFTSGNPNMDGGYYCFYGWSLKKSWILVDVGLTKSHDKWHPMVRLATESEDFAPYSNICPISGHTQVEVENHQKNLYIGSPSFDGYTNISYYTLESETYEGNEVYSRSSSWSGAYYPMLLKGGVTYTFSAMVKRASSSDAWIYATSSNGGSFAQKFTIGTSWTKVSITFTPNSDDVFNIRVESVDSVKIYLSEYQLELGSTATAYVPYNGYLITVNLGGTYYSGTLDVVSGVFTVDSAFIASYNGETLPSTWISDRDVYAVGTTPTTGAEVCYKLATPQTIQLTPQQVKALVGENHLSAPLDGQEITESVYSPLAKWNAVIDDTTASNDTTYSSNKINTIVPKIDDNTTSASKVFSSLKTANLITELSERFDFSTTEKPLGWWTDGKVYYGKVINIMGCPKEMFGLMVDLGVEVDTFIGIFAVGNAKDDNYNGGYCMGGTIYCKVIKSEGQNTQIQPACAVMALGGASLLVLYTKVE